MFNDEMGPITANMIGDCEQINNPEVCNNCPFYDLCFNTDEIKEEKGDDEC